MVTPTSFGAQPISQQMTTYLNGIDYMTDEVTFQEVQNGDRHRPFRPDRPAAEISR